MNATSITLTDGRGRELVTSIDDEAAWKALEKVPENHKDRSFSRSIAKAYDSYAHQVQPNAKFSAAQRFWMHKIALDQLGREKLPDPTVTGPVAQLTAIVTFLEPASKTRKSGACVTFQNNMPGSGLSNDGTVQIKRASAHGKNAGSYWVSNGVIGQSNGNELYARIDQQGNLWGHRGVQIPVPVLALLDTFEDDPKAFVMQYGVRTGRCCFCNTILDGADEISAKLGFGPVCARTYHLPHGKKGLEELNAMTTRPKALQHVS